MNNHIEITKLFADARTGAANPTGIIRHFSQIQVGNKHYHGQLSIARSDLFSRIIVWVATIYLLSTPRGIVVSFQCGAVDKIEAINDLEKFTQEWVQAQEETSANP